MRRLAPVLGASLLLWPLAPVTALAAPEEAAIDEHINLAGAPDDTDVEEAFGAVLALTEDRLVVGALEHAYPRTRAGQVYAFGRVDDGWSAQQVLGPDDELVATGCGCRGASAGSLGFLASFLLVRRRRT